ncbi:MAG TPA: diguanylate cyclase [candidate division Zixibacteria bacterium]|nr:diguanylate cyclase [candidate division Zixibacteria bacterium]
MQDAQKEKTPLTVLVIEDHPDQRDLLAIVLQREGYKVITASNGLEALERLAKEPVQIILSDIMMPKMDGFELIHKVRSNPAFKNIYLILITARIQEGDRVRGLDLGADDYITKPFSFSELLARVRVGTRVVQYQQHLEHQSHVDSLTGLFNRRAFEKKIEEEFERSKRYQHPISLLILDIDNFKTINDTYGHHGGDTALVKIAEILRERTRQSDFPSRYGGEEFVLILPETDQESALQAARKIHEEIRASSYGTANATFHLTVSIGLASTSTKEYPDWRKMLDDADQALYRAKHNGKDRIELSVPEKNQLRGRTPAVA